MPIFSQHKNDTYHSGNNRRSPNPVSQLLKRWTFSRRPTNRPSQGARNNMANLDSLPDELLLDIINHLPSGFSALNLTCRRFHHLTTPYLYSTYLFCDVDASPFLRTIAATEGLASYVKTINWNNSHEDIQRAHKSLGVNITAYHELLQILGRLNKPYAKALVRELTYARSEDDDKVLNAILGLATNVETLYVAETSRWNHHTYWIPVFLSHTPQPFAHLRSAKLGGPLRIENVAALLVLPSMRTLELSQVLDLPRKLAQSFQWDDGDGFLSFEALLQRHRSNVEHFHIEKSHIELESLIPALGAFKRLKSFTYEHQESCLPSSRQHVPGWGHLFSQLSLHSDTLTSLRLSYSAEILFYNDPLLPEDKLWEFVPFIRGFPHLQTLSVTRSPLQEATNRTPLSEILPANLKTLILLPGFSDAEDYRDQWDTHLVSADLFLYDIIHQVTAGKLSCLRTIETRDWHPWYGHYPPSVEAIKTTFANIGITFSSIPAEEGKQKELITTCDDIEPGWDLVDIDWHYS